MNDTNRLAKPYSSARGSFLSQSAEDRKNTHVASLAAEMICPTCRASQIWTDQCHRCKSDLSELRSIHRATTRLRFRCLSAIQRGDIATAIDTAEECFELDTSPSVARLLAVCHLLNHDLSEALRTYFGLKTENGT